MLNWQRALDLVHAERVGLGTNRAAMREIKDDMMWMTAYMKRKGMFKQIYAALDRCDLFVAVGTSGTVYPAAGFVSEARRGGAHTVELTLEPGEISDLFEEQHYGPATEVVPDWVRGLG